MQTRKPRYKYSRKNNPVTTRIDPTIQGQSFYEDPNMRFRLASTYSPAIVKRRICR